VADGVWSSKDSALRRMLNNVCVPKTGYFPDIDLECARIAQQELGAEITEVNLPEVTYPSDAIF